VSRAKPAGLSPSLAALAKAVLPFLDAEERRTFPKDLAEWAKIERRSNQLCTAAARAKPGSARAEKLGARADVFIETAYGSRTGFLEEAFGRALSNAVEADERRTKRQTRRVA
jgi:hypothetical protein